MLNARVVFEEAYRRRDVQLVEFSIPEFQINHLWSSGLLETLLLFYSPEQSVKVSQRYWWCVSFFPNGGFHSRGNR